MYVHIYLYIARTCNHKSLLQKSPTKETYILYVHIIYVCTYIPIYCERTRVRRTYSCLSLLHTQRRVVADRESRLKSLPQKCDSFVFMCVVMYIYIASGHVHNAQGRWNALFFADFFLRKKLSGRHV